MASLTLRWRRFSRRCSPSGLRRLLLVTVLVLLVVLGAIAVGRVVFSPWQTLALLMGQGEPGPVFIVQQLRLPRLLLAALVGAALALSGLILQSLVRNPLASPDLLGITGGASAGAVLYLALLAPIWGSDWLPLAAILGAILAALVVYLLAWRQGVSPLRLVLVGVGVTALAAALTTFTLVFSPLTTTLSAYVWLTGSVYGATGEQAAALAWCLLLVLLPLVPLARTVPVQQLDDDAARGLGVRLQWVRAGLLLVSVGLAGAAVAWGGAMAFVGLIAPHMARRLIGGGFVMQAIMAGLLGGLLVVLADLVGRTLFLPLDLPAGIFVAVLGAPYFLYLLLRQTH
ncbi:iron ABC transporter permease [Halopseudomonas oceani]|uniref:FecCD family ABC transporter permease n=1 Tax=Halopseudomonas oceani TaxID=1708783 RepID=UPI002AA7C43A|nr:iron ABC transporter permease [Halopseudomonas oceani]